MENLVTDQNYVLYTLKKFDKFKIFKKNLPNT